MSTTAKKGKGKLIAFIIALVIIAASIVFLVVLNKKQASAVMECNVNPNVQFVLDQNNNVMRVNYLNEDAEALLKEVNFNGKSADEAAKLFVELSTEAGFIEVQTTGTRVDVTISCEKPEKYADLQQKIVNKVNKYFDENGIVAGAVASVKANLADAVEKIGVSASKLANKTTEEIFALYEEQSKELEDIAVSLHGDFFEFVENLKNTTFSMLDSLEEAIAELEETINNANIPNELKDLAKKELDNAKKLYNENKDAFKKMVDDKIAELKELSKTIFAQAKTALENAKNEVKQAIADYKTYYEQNKAAVDQAIADYRASLIAE